LLKETVFELWKVEKGFEMRSIATYTFLFSFGHDVERDRILQNELWNFFKALIVMKKLEVYEGKDWGSFKWTPFWIQIHGLPLHAISEDIGGMLGNKIGQCTKVDTDAYGRCIGKFMRVQVWLDATTPVRRCANVHVGSNGNVVWWPMGASVGDIGYYGDIFQCSYSGKCSAVICGSCFYSCKGRDNTHYDKKENQNPIFKLIYYYRGA
ncbi:hypothetical protein TorRG33x02_336020, partial [Trema orientale]